MISKFIELTVSQGNYNTKYLAFVRKENIVSVIQDDLGEKYPSIKISLVNGDMLNVWGYNAKEFIELITE
jgi:hypothetical protein